MSFDMREFFASDSGAVTVDWVVLTAAVVGLGVGVTVVLWDSMTTTEGSLHRQLSEHSISTSFK